MSASKDSPYSNLYRPSVSRKWFKLACVVLVTVVLLYLFTKANFEYRPEWQDTTSPIEEAYSEPSHILEEIPEQSSVVEEDPLGPLAVLNGPPTTSFRGVHFGCLQAGHSSFLTCCRQFTTRCKVYFIVARCWMECVAPFRFLFSH